VGYWAAACPQKLHMYRAKTIDIMGYISKIAGLVTELIFLSTMEYLVHYDFNSVSIIHRRRGQQE
jgi:hypothetical protein